MTALCVLFCVEGQSDFAHKNAWRPRFSSAKEHRHLAEYLKVPSLLDFSKSVLATVF